MTATMNSEEKARLLLDVVEDRKAVDPVLLDLRGKTLLFDFCLVCSGTSNVHIRSIADALLERAAEAHLDKPRTSGQENAEWVLLDFGDAVVHILAEETRERYKLEQFWSTPQPKGALPPTPEMARSDHHLDAIDLDDEDRSDAAFFDDADQEVEPIEEDDLDDGLDEDRESLDEEIDEEEEEGEDDEDEFDEDRPQPLP